MRFTSKDFEGYWEQAVQDNRPETEVMAEWANEKLAKIIEQMNGLFKESHGKLIEALKDSKDVIMRIEDNHNQGLAVQDDRTALLLNKFIKKWSPA